MKTIELMTSTGTFSFGRLSWRCYR